MTSQQRVVKNISRSAPQPAIQAKIVVDLKADEIRKKAFELAMVRRNYDDYIWMWAESELKLRSAYCTPLVSNLNKIEIDKANVVDKPSVEDVKKLASELASKRPKVQDVHWFIAERQYIFNAVKTVKGM